VYNRVVTTKDAARAREDAPMSTTDPDDLGRINVKAFERMDDAANADIQCVAAFCCKGSI